MEERRYDRLLASYTVNHQRRIKLLVDRMGRRPDSMQRKNGSKGTSIGMRYYPLGMRKFSNLYHGDKAVLCRKFEKKHPVPSTRNLPLPLAQEIQREWREKHDTFIEESLLNSKEFQKARQEYLDSLAELKEQSEALPEYPWLTKRFESAGYRIELAGKEVRIPKMLALIVFDQKELDRKLMKVGKEAGEIDWRPTETLPEDYYAL